MVEKPWFVAGSVSRSRLIFPTFHPIAKHCALTAVASAKQTFVESSFQRDVSPAPTGSFLPGANPRLLVTERGREAKL